MAKLVILSCILNYVELIVKELIIVRVWEWVGFGGCIFEGNLHTW